MEQTLFIVLGNQLFPPSSLSKYKGAQIWMCEDDELCTYYKHHQLKITLFLTAMREYADGLISKGFEVKYTQLQTKPHPKNYEQKLKEGLKGIKRVVFFEIEDKFFETRIKKMLEELSMPYEVLPSPMFMCLREDFESYLKSVKTPLMKSFYESQRKKHGILIEKKGTPVGGKWSFDAENRKKLPQKITLPKLPTFKDSEHLGEVKTLVKKRFADHVGDTSQMWMPTQRKDYLKLLDRFLQECLSDFGPYQDALSDKNPFLFHSLLSCGLNLGLILPSEVVEKTLDYYEQHQKQIPLSSVEGFIRQVMGWREFIRGIYQNYSQVQEEKNFWKHERGMEACWYEGTTGLDPVDEAIGKARTYGYNHHIERLMVLSSTMLMCEIHPQKVHQWFMEMYVDSSDWVMGPNVYGMGQFSDGGIFATKPYICGSNYILKMSRFKKGPWCEVMDSLYWHFVSKNLSFFQKNPRMKMMVSHLDKMEAKKKKQIHKVAQEFIEKVTC